ncbi:DUF1194 domain-containing protein [Oceanibium sediminis]|uniref:DUF1194 domain-containing protein n=1 Tax=Oceanibium sediminis TaxID=2026339 RepID=UPI000DD3970C|nr:DUF1194 domain-containing protein [Oceanibium sediminis]
MTFRTLAVLAGLLPLAGPPALSQSGGSGVPVDLELALAVDTSRSMDLDELHLQREGYAAALEHPAVTSALVMGRLGRTALTYYEWGGPGNIRVIVDWTLIESPEDARAAARRLREAPITNLRGTSISGAMEHAAAEMALNGFDGTRRVVDISGDGPNNRGTPVAEARDRLAALGIEVNGLPFMVKDPYGSYAIPDLDFYYEDCVITGESAFVIPIQEMDRLIGSIRQKLVLEISGLAPPARARLRRVSTTDCMIGERLRRRWDQDLP